MPELLKLSGPARVRGRIHGAALRAGIDETVRRYRDFTAGVLHRDPLIVFDEFIADSGYIPTIQLWLPELIDELAGIAESAGQRFVDILVLNLCEELISHILRALADEEIAELPGNCTVIAAPPTAARAGLLAQNLDLLDWQAGHPVLLQVESGADALGFLSVATAGSLGFCGGNSLGLAIGSNTLPMLDSSATGLPAFACRQLLFRQADAAAAQALLHDIPHASGMAYTLVDATAVAVVECSANSTVDCTLATGPFHIHTNHPLANTDSGQSDRLLQEAGGDDLQAWQLSAAPESMRRYQALAQRCRGVDPDIAGMFALLQASVQHRQLSIRHPYAPADAPAMSLLLATAQSVVCETGSAVRLHFATGEPAITECVSTLPASP